MNVADRVLDRRNSGTCGARPSNHVTPHGAVATARHYIRDLVYGANDGIITTFAVVAGVAGGALSARAVLIVGAANLAADGLSMAAGNFLSIRSHEGARAADGLPEEEAFPWKHSIATFLAFVLAGTTPLVPYVLPLAPPLAFRWSGALTFFALFTVGAARSAVTVDTWWRAGLEMSGLGVVVAAAAYASGAAIATILG
jgi:VIT1/CCC1 family predicted Fe2+/Mn2+ transporter